MKLLEPKGGRLLGAARRRTRPGKSPAAGKAAPAPGRPGLGILHGHQSDKKYSDGCQGTGHEASKNRILDHVHLHRNRIRVASFILTWPSDQAASARFSVLFKKLKIAEGFSGACGPSRRTLARFSIEPGWHRTGIERLTRRAQASIYPHCLSMAEGRPD
jgi:hypothetical protein